MILLRDLLDVMFDITEMEITARKPEGERIHGFYFSEKDFARLSPGTKRSIQYGETTFVQGRINIFGKPKRNGFSETAFSVELKMIPKELLDAEVTHLLDCSLQYGRHLYVEIALHELQCEAARANLQKRAFDLSGYKGDKE